MRPGPPGGAVALPLPRGDPGALWSGAGTLRAAAAALHGRDASGVVEGAWSGAAADEAVAELGLVASRTTAWVDRAGRAGAALVAYGDTLDAAQRAVATLQASWDSTVPPDPLDVAAASVSAPALAHLSGAYAVVVADLELAGGVAIHRLRELVAEVVAPDRPGRRAALTGWASPPPDDAAVRRAVLGELPLVSGAERRADAARLAADVAGDLAAAAAGDVWGVDRAASTMGAVARDPLVAREIWSRLDPATSAHLLDALTGPIGATDAGWTNDRRAALLDALGTALALAVNPTYAAGLDPESRAQQEAWRGPWLAGLAASVGRITPRPDGGATGGSWVQGQLLAGARRAGLSPGSAYAATVGVAMVAVDRVALTAPPGLLDGAAHDLAGDGRRLRATDDDEDAVHALAEALGSDVEAARAWLLAPLPGSSELVVDHLVRGRYVGLGTPEAAASMAAVAGLVVTAGSDEYDRRSVQVAAAFVGAVGAETRTAASPDAFRRALAPALDGLGTVLARHPLALTGVLDDSTTAGTDAAGLSSTQRLTRSGAAPGTWTIVLADRPTAAAVVGQLAFGAGGNGPGTAEDTSARDPARSPALARLVDAVGARLDDDLATAVRAEQAGDPHAVDAVAYRWGQTLGFTLASAGEALAGRDADADARNAAIGSVVDAAVDKVTVPGWAGKAVTPLVHLAAQQAVAAALPTGAEAAQRQATTAAVTAARDAAYVELRSAVSRAHPWTETQSPARWAEAASTSAAPGVPRFWDDRGLPLPESEMTTSQRRAFTDWRRQEGLSVYDTVPERVREGIDEGVRGTVLDPGVSGAR